MINNLSLKYLKKRLYLIVKKLKRWQYHNKIRYQLFLNTSSTSRSKSLFTLNAHVSDIDIVTIAFNNPKMIDYQIRLLQKNILDKFTHIIADNSTNRNARTEIFNICKRLGALYVSLPVHHYKGHDSHAVAMHWVYKNVIKKRNRPYFGFIDHDIFPLKSCSILQRFINGIYGRVTPPYNPAGEFVPVTKTQPYWSLWAGFCFIKSELLYSLDVSSVNFFLKKTENGLLDTGGGLWDCLLSKIPYPGEIAQYSCERFRTSGDSNIHTDYVEYIDEWVHMRNLSNWYKTPDYQEKISYFETILQEALQD